MNTENMLDIVMYWIFEAQANPANRTSASGGFDCGSEGGLDFLSWQVAGRLGNPNDYRMPPALSPNLLEADHHGV